MASKIIIANWKMHKSFHEAEKDFQILESFISTQTDPHFKVFIAPPSIYLLSLSDKQNHIGLLAQNCFPAHQGAFTGEISPGMILDLKVLGSLVGHSERRTLFGETLDFIHQKIEHLLQKNLRSVLCIGETRIQREEGQWKETLKHQLVTALKGVTLDPHQENPIWVAYEPVWAIGTGLSAEPQDVQQAHAFIQSVLNDLFPKVPFSVLYGGSVNPKNAKTLLTLPYVDGLLVGSASLDPTSFIEILKQVPVS